MVAAPSLELSAGGSGNVKLSIGNILLYIFPPVPGLPRAFLNIQFFHNNKSLINVFA
jgi:hypothetical protein